jgi:hypothetical protein
VRPVCRVEVNHEWSNHELASFAAKLGEEGGGSSWLWCGEDAHATRDCSGKD